jgi:alpha-beta hydrolase superfamily lysophospholipase
MDEATLAAHLAEHNPIDRLKPLAEAGVPILHVHGDSDTVVPIEKNSGELAHRYIALGGKMRLIVVPGKGHQVAPEFFQCRKLVDFVIAEALANRGRPRSPTPRGAAEGLHGPAESVASGEACAQAFHDPSSGAFARFIRILSNTLQ